MAENEMTSIAVTQVTRDKLAGICRKDQSYDEFINVLIDMWKKYGGLVQKK